MRETAIPNAGVRSATVFNRAYSALLSVAVICFLGALITDLAYAAAPAMLWLDFSTWFLLAGLVSGGVAGVVLIVAVIRAGSGRTRALLVHLLFLFAAWLTEVFNSFIHARDGWTAVVPTGLTLSVLAMALSLVAAWFWQSAHLQTRVAK